jgi:PKD repeat protein
VRIGEKPIPVGEQVVFSAELQQADSLAVEWNFGDGTKETVSKHQSKQPVVRHLFTKEGKLTVTATIHTDDLATPTVTLSTNVIVGEEKKVEETQKEKEEREKREKEETQKQKEEREKREREEREKREKERPGTPVALATGPWPHEPVEPGETVLFDGSFSSDPAGPSQITEYRWTFGDGTQHSGLQAVVEHSYAQEGKYTVTLTITDKAGHTSLPYTLPHQVVVKRPSSGEGIGAGSSLTSSGTQPSGAVSSFTHASTTPVPVVTLAFASLAASSSGALSVTLYCPGNESVCAGAITLRARAASGGGHGHKPKFTLLTLASASFTLRGGVQKRFVLHLTRSGRALLGRLHRLNAQALIAAHDPAGATHTTQLVVALRLAPAGRAKHAKR